MDEPTVTGLRTLAELRHRDPESVRARSAAALTAVGLDPTVRAAAEWVHGLALHELGRAAAAVPHFRAAILGGDPVTVAAARASLAMSLLAAGESAAARRAIGRARADMPPGALRYVEPLWAVYLQRTGRLDDALDVFDRLVPALEREADRAGLARTLLNRGTLLAYQGRFDRAVADLAGAEDLAAELGHDLLTAMAAHNLGFTEGRRFMVPAGLAAFDRARSAYRAVGDPPRQVAVLLADHCELLLHAGLARDARAAALDALGTLARDPDFDRSHETEIRLLLAHAHLQSGDGQAAAEEAGRAADGFRRAGRRPWVSLAHYVGIRAEVLVAEEDRAPHPALVRRARAVVRALDAGGWPTEAAHARALLGRLATAAGDVRSARRELTAVAQLRGRGSVDVRTAGWHARALLLLADGDRPGAKRALRRGLALVEEHRAAFTATELRAGAAVQAQELARLGLRLALADGRPMEVLRWAERGRAGALRLPPVAPPPDSGLAAALADLHAERAARGSRVAALETEIRNRTLRSDSGMSASVTRIDLAGVRGALTGTLVEYVAMEQRLYAVVLTGTAARLVELGPVEPVAREVTYLLAGHRRRLAGRSGSAATADRLAELLLAPLSLEDTTDLVVVPAGLLHDVPWSALPPLYGRRVVVAPSAHLWHARRRPRRRADAVVLVAGPGLPGAVDEVRALTELYPAAECLTGPAATVPAVLEALGRADLVHVAAHGHYRSDSPLFSALELADRSLTMYELDAAAHVPPTVVLPACDAGRTTVLTGDELLGTATALIARGVRSVVAPVLPVPDGPTSRVMVELHRGLARGAAPSQALADAARAVADDPELRAVAAAFVCVGAAEPHLAAEPHVTAPGVPSPRSGRPETRSAPPAALRPQAARR